jgi:3-hydroxyacyl-CoA dehydrogenase
VYRGWSGNRDHNRANLRDETMRNKIDKVAILGAGIMGSQLAAHLANIKIPSLLFDISQEQADQGLKSVQEMKPAAFFSPSNAAYITRCNYKDHLQMIGEVDWVIEAVIEQLDIKRDLYHRIMPFLKPQAVVSSNTSGISLKELTTGFPIDFQNRFLITHFFNPPRYMHLLEIVSGEKTLPQITETLVSIAENLLGKGIVYAKDTPNFVANRIGIYGMMMAIKLTREFHLSVEEVDKLTGPIIGHPKSATYRTADLVGLDTLAYVAQTSFNKCISDEAREFFRIPDFLQKLIKNKWLGAKTKKGFYQKMGKEIFSLDFETLSYMPQKKIRLDGFRIAKKEWTTPRKIHTLAYSDDIAGKFIWELLSNTLIYCANRIPEITNNIVNIDNAMKWGYGWELGPFETWEALGLEKSLERMKAENKHIPEWVQRMYNEGNRSFYRIQRKNISYFDISSTKYRVPKFNPKVIQLHVLKNSGKELQKNWNASLIDLGDGVALVEFHSIVQPVYHPIDGAMLDMISNGIDFIQESGYKSLVIGHQGQHFTAGANLAMILKYSEEHNWGMLEKLSKTFQNINQKIRFAPIPVVAAPFQMCLGGGYEIVASCDVRVASAELYCGLVEVSVGLIAGAGGSVRLLLSNLKSMRKNNPGPFPVVRKTFETIAFARVSTSAKEALFLGYLSEGDQIVINPDHLIFEAKEEALRLAKDYQPPVMETEIYLPGEAGRLAIETIIEGLKRAGKISEHDTLIGKKLAYVLTGGDRASPPKPVDEKYMLDIEREAFISLCAEPLSQQRMAHMLKTGKPLRN